MLNYRDEEGRGDDGGGTNCIFWKILPLRALLMTPFTPDYENCKEHLPTHLTFTPSFRDFQPSISSVIFLVLHFYWAALQNSSKINCVRMSAFDYKSLSNVWFLTMEENSFAKVNAKKTKNHSIPENALFYTQSLNTPQPPLILTHPFYQHNYSLRRNSPYCDLPPHFRTFVLTTQPSPY